MSLIKQRCYYCCYHVALTNMHLNFVISVYTFKLDVVNE